MQRGKLALHTHPECVFQRQTTNLENGCTGRSLIAKTMQGIFKTFLLPWAHLILIMSSNRWDDMCFPHSVQSLSHVRLFATPWTAARQAALSITNSQSLLKLMSIESVMPSTISSSVVPFSSCLQSFPVSRSFQMSQFFALGGQSIGISALASVLPMNILWISSVQFSPWVVSDSLRAYGLC